MRGEAKRIAVREGDLTRANLLPIYIAVKHRFVFFLSFIFFLLILAPPGMPKESNGNLKGGSFPILLYHRFGPVAADSMTVTTPVFESHLRYLQENGYRVISLREMVEQYRQGRVPGRSDRI